MESLLIRNARVYTPLETIEDGFVYAENGVIKRVGRRGWEPACGGSCSIVDAEGMIVAPGFIDTHIHGYRGRDANDCSPDSLLEISRGLVEHGVTAFIPSTVTAPHSTLLEASRAVREAAGSWDGVGARILGLHLEGPYISPEKRGAQNPEYIRPASRRELEEYIRESGGLIRQITIAPEVEGALELIGYAVSQGITVSIGHTNASYETTRAAIEAGASKATHIYNAMRTIHHREPGPVIALLESPSVYIEVIADLIHVSPPMIRAAVRLAGVHRIVLVSDAISATMLPDGRYKLGGLDVVVENGVPRLADTGALAGSTLTLDRAVRNIHSIGYGVGEALVMATLNPALSVNALYRDHIGVIRPGFMADLVILDNKLYVSKTIVGGRIVFEKGS